jgi:uncharacterized protein
MILKVPVSINFSRRSFMKDLVYFSTATFCSSFFLSCTNAKNNVFGAGKLASPQFKDVTIAGDLLLRAQRNFDRLHDPIFRYKNIADHTLKDPYPGDFLGRTVLGLVQLTQVLKQEPLYLDEIIERFPNELINEKGYTGKVLKNGFYDEIQITGHQFFLRGLCELYLWKKEDTIRNIIESTVKNMMIPLATDINSYPLQDERQNLKMGGAVAMDAGLVENWQLSTDTCQLFMVLDGLTQVYQLFPSEELGRAIEQIFDFYSQIDLLKIKAQTHSTLSASRGLLRFYELTGNVKYLNFVKRIFVDYKEHAMTENYENFNWFGRPEHTEGCAVIDAFLLAVELWKSTGQLHYLNDAHLIYYNGVQHNQWTNGGYGVNSCVGPARNVSLTHKVEATWCCTMRGSEGLAKAGQYNYFYDQDNIYLPFYHNGSALLRFKEGELQLRLESSYPEKGDIRLSILNSSLERNKKVHFFIPEWIDQLSIKIKSGGKQVNGKMKDGFFSFMLIPGNKEVVTITFDVKFYKKVPHHEEVRSGYIKYFHGPLLLGYAGEKEIKISKHEEFRSTKGPVSYKSQSGILLKPLNTLKFGNVTEQKNASFQFLFQEM